MRRIPREEEEECGRKPILYSVPLPGTSGQGHTATRCVNGDAGAARPDPDATGKEPRNLVTWCNRTSTVNAWGTLEWPPSVQEWPLRRCVLSTRR